MKSDREIFMNAPTMTSPEQLERYIDRECGDCDSLRRRVVALFDAAERAGTFMESSEHDDSGLGVVEALGEREGSEIGNYRLGPRLGEGGFGAVYAAEQLRPVKRTVALKIIKLGMDTRQVVARFEAERQALARMDHPGIATVHDAGATDSGRPYFVMELVDGISITRFCDENKLNTRKRLELFCDVCRAVQHAHQKGIIHRDITPSNILVAKQDGLPVPKVIDFGIAKATRAEAADMKLTRQGQFMGTPAYMSPEQAASGAGDIDTRTDIYSLGVLLYELLTGRTPFETSGGLEEVRRRIREETPRKPSTRVSTRNADERDETAARRSVDSGRLQRLLQGDLDWIVMKALEKDRGRRYETANALRVDILRYLTHEPVSASPPGVLYFAGKFVRRHRVVLAVCALVAALLGVAVWQMYGNRFLKLEAQIRSQEQAHLAQFPNVAGRRTLGLRAVSRMVSGAPSPDLRSQAIACLALLDISRQPGVGWGGAPPGMRALTFDPPLRRYARCDRDGSVSIRGVGDDRELLRLDGKYGSASRMLFGGGGQRLAIWSSGDGGGGGRLTVVGLPGGDVLLEAGTGPHAETFDFSADGQWIAFGTAENLIEVRHLADTERIYRTELAREPYRVRFQPTGRMLAIDSLESRHLFVVEWRTGEVSRRYFEDAFEDMAWHPEGHLICVASKNDPVLLCPVHGEGQSVGPISLSRSTVGVTRVAFSADGSFLATADSKGVLQLWDPIAGISHVELNTGKEFSHLQISTDSKRLACSRDGESLQLWNLTPNADVHVLRRDLNPTPHASEVVFAPTGNALLLTSHEGVRVWDWANRRYLGTLAVGEIHDLAWQEESGWLILAGHRGVLRVKMGIERGARHDELVTTAVRLFDAPPPCRAVDLGSKGETLVAQVAGGSRIFAPQQFGQSAAPLLIESKVQDVAVHPSEPVIAVMGESTLHLYARKGNRFEKVSESAISGGRSLRYSPDGKYLVVGTRAGYRVHRSDGMERVAEIPCPFYAGHRPIAFDSSTSHVALTQHSSEIALLRLSDRKMIARLPASGSTPVTGLAFSPSGRELAVAYFDQTAEVWTLASIREQLRAYDLDWQPESPMGNGPKARPIVWFGRDNVFEVKERNWLRNHEVALVSAGVPPVERARATHFLRDYAGAGRLFRQCLEDEPGNPRILNDLAISELYQNHAVEAARLWERCLELDGDYHRALVWLALVYLLRPDQEENRARGHAFARRLAQMEVPRGAEYMVRFVRVASAFREERYPDCVRMIRDVNGAPKCGLRLLLAMSYFRTGNPKLAEIAYKEAIRQWRRNPALYRAHGLVLPLRREADATLGHEPGALPPRLHREHRHDE